MKSLDKERRQLEKAGFTGQTLERAMELLATTSLSNVEISRLTGFSDYNYFYRVFRRQTGLTPRRYRTSMVADT